MTTQLLVLSLALGLGVPLVTRSDTAIEVARSGAIASLLCVPLGVLALPVLGPGWTAAVMAGVGLLVGQRALR